MFTTYVVVHHPANETFCEGTDAVLSCTISDNNNVADNTVWFNFTSRARIESNMDTVVNNNRNDDMVTSILNITDISVCLNNTEYICVPSLGIQSFPGVLIIIGENYTHTRTHVRTHTHTHTYTHTHTHTHAHIHTERNTCILNAIILMFGCT